MKKTATFLSTTNRKYFSIQWKYCRVCDFRDAIVAVINRQLKDESLECQNIGVIRKKLSLKNNLVLTQFSCFLPVASCDKTNSLTENALLRYLILFVNRNQESQLVPDIFPLIYFCKHVCLSRDA